MPTHRFHLREFLMLGKVLKLKHRWEVVQGQRPSSGNSARLLRFRSTSGV